MHVARALCTVAHPVLVVGPASGTDLPTVDDAREGPLRALVAGADALGGARPVLVLACDLPFVSAELLRFVAHARGDADAAVPVLGGRDQPLAACYSPAALDRARALVADGRDAMRDLLAAIAVRRIPEEEWTRVAPAQSLSDVDTPEELAVARTILSAPE